MKRLVHRFKYAGHTIEIHLKGKLYHLTLDAECQKMTFLSSKSAFISAVGRLEKKHSQIYTDLMKAAQAMSKEASSNAEVIRKLERAAEVEMDSRLIHLPLKGNYDFPSEPAEIDVLDAWVESLPDLSIEDAEKLPHRFHCNVSAKHTGDDFDVDVVLTFDVTINSKKIISENKVELDFSSRFIDWDYS